MAGTTELLVTFPGGKRVDARLGDHVIRTDQPAAAGGAGSAPTPYELFLASLGTCAGIFVLGFCQQRGLPTDGIRVAQRAHHDPETGALLGVDLDVVVPETFPEKYREALVRVADQCKVKKAIQRQPEFRVRTVVG
ncbi:OsmC family protein [Anaeromyxobacter paludicola]|uniref:Osmotically inducible protein C n=1 Tax=Anaeromyxobacter paludicola TaxID=2918171 RepID=A0ABN6NAS3_9BACT|nr:OsmC family protein [Anaeromyxobacter paludicola]BDG09408.1 osmotically inducible protein C [Anaeromyxobacter paludicola]